MKRQDDDQAAQIGAVAIGRNEGERLARCLDSLLAKIPHVVYVDSGSTDDSVALAQARGVEVVALDMSVPFTAARARNAGFERLTTLHPQIAMVQMVDGDCELVDGWVDAAVAAMRADAAVVAVCGWRRERFPDRSPYNMICDVEWRSGQVGETRAFGGDVLIRASALAAVGGYDPGVIAAEDDELGIRLRRAGGKLIRIDKVSTLHDAAMTKMDQWWKRAKRCGHAYAQVADMHGAPPERYFKREVKSVVTWGMALPAVAVGMALPSLGTSLMLLGAYPMQALRIFRGARKRGFPRAKVSSGVCPVPRPSCPRPPVC